MAIGLFTEEFEIPHPPVDLSVLLILEEGIRAAWQLLRQEPPATLNLAVDLEEPINFHLYETLVDRVWNRGVVDGFDENFFRAIECAPEVCNYNKKELKKRPDMIVKLTGRSTSVKPSQDGVFIECKPVDASHSLTSHYCNRGVTRFIVGRYGWAMQEALMVGYVLVSHDIVTELSQAFGTRASTVLSEGVPQVCSSGNGTVVSQHRRSFIYNHNNAQAGNITLRHLWLLRN